MSDTFTAGHHAAVAGTARVSSSCIVMMLSGSDSATAPASVIVISSFICARLQILYGVVCFFAGWGVDRCCSGWNRRSKLFLRYFLMPSSYSSFIGCILLFIFRLPLFWHVECPFHSPLAGPLRHCGAACSAYHAMFM